MSRWCRREAGDVVVVSRLRRILPPLVPATSATGWPAQPHTHTQTHRLMAPCPGPPRRAGTRKVKPMWILLKQETVSGSGISWAICMSAPRSRQITMPAPHHLVFALPAVQLTASKHWRHKCIPAQAKVNNTDTAVRSLTWHAAMGTHMHTVLPTTRQRWHSHLYPSQSWYSINRPWRVGWLQLHTETVYPPEDGHPSKYWPGPTCDNFVHIAGLAESKGSLPPGICLTSPAGWLPRTGISCYQFRCLVNKGTMGVNSLPKTVTRQRRHQQFAV